jgi:hypothetical protein
MVEQACFIDEILLNLLRLILEGNRAGNSTVAG